MAYSTFRRYLYRNGLKITDEQRSRLQSRAARKGRNRDARHAHPCAPSCTCKRHRDRRPRAEKVNAVICGRRFCSDCKHWRLIIDFHVRHRDERGEPISFQSICMTCQRIRTRYTQGIRRRGKPFGPRPPKKSPAEQRARNRELYAERRKDPEWVEQRREYERIYQEAKRREAGVPRDEAKIAKRNIGPDTWISTAAFAQWLDWRVQDYQGSWNDLAAACGVSQRALYRYRFDGDAQQEVSSGFVDKCLLHEGSTFMWQLYPHLFGMADTQLQESEPLLALTG